METSKEINESVNTVLFQREISEQLALLIRQPQPTTQETTSSFFNALASLASAINRLLED